MCVDIFVHDGKKREMGGEGGGREIIPHFVRFIVFNEVFNCVRNDDVCVKSTFTKCIVYF